MELTRPGEFPVRFTTGLATFRKPRYSTYWVPILFPELLETHIAILHTDDRFGDFPDAELTLTLHRSFDEQTLTRTLPHPRQRGILRLDSGDCPWH